MIWLIIASGTRNSAPYGNCKQLRAITWLCLRVNKMISGQCLIGSTISKTLWLIIRWNILTDATSWSNGLKRPNLYYKQLIITPRSREGAETHVFISISIIVGVIILHAYGGPQFTVTRKRKELRKIFRELPKPTPFLQRKLPRTSGCR